MSCKKTALILALILPTFSILGAGSAFAGSKPIGMIVHSMGATVAGQSVPDSMALFDGDEVQVKGGGAAIIRLANGSIMRLSNQTTATFARQGSEVKVRLSHGRLSMAQPTRGTPLAVSAGGVSIHSAEGSSVAGHITMRNNQLSVTSARGQLQVEGSGLAMKAGDGESITLNKVPSVAAETTSPRWVVSTAQTDVTNRGANPFRDRSKNPIAVGNVGAHVPPAACQHAASPSVPSVACDDLGSGQ